MDQIMGVSTFREKWCNKYTVRHYWPPFSGSYCVAPSRFLWSFPFGLLTAAPLFGGPLLFLMVMRLSLVEPAAADIPLRHNI